MAEDWKSKRDIQRQREKEDEKEIEFLRARMKKTGATMELSPPSGGSPSDQTETLIDQAEPLLEKVNSLYQQYFAGEVKTPPVVPREQLDRLMSTLAHVSKPTAAVRFRVGNLQSRYSTYKDRWDKLSRELEQGRGRRTG